LQILQFSKGKLYLARRTYPDCSLLNGASRVNLVKRGACIVVARRQSASPGEFRFTSVMHVVHGSAKTCNIKHLKLF
jgi:hypothetical protein